MEIQGPASLVVQTDKVPEIKAPTKEVEGGEGRREKEEEEQTGGGGEEQFSSG